MSSVVPSPDPHCGPTSDSLDATNVIVVGNEDTTVRPVDPRRLPQLRELKRLLEEREQRLKAEREREQPPGEQPPPSAQPQG
jgi:hypothetical protein